MSDTCVNLRTDKVKKIQSLEILIRIGVWIISKLFAFQLLMENFVIQVAYFDVKADFFVGNVCNITSVISDLQVCRS